VVVLPQARTKIGNPSAATPQPELQPRSARKVLATKITKCTKNGKSTKKIPNRNVPAELEKNRPKGRGADF
jgi:hypothetical protein